MVWKAAFCSEIDAKIAQVRALSAKVVEIEEGLTGLRAECKAWRAACRNTALDLATAAPASSDRSAPEGEHRPSAYDQMLAASRGWMKTAIDQVGSSMEHRPKSAFGDKQGLRL